MTAVMNSIVSYLLFSAVIVLGALEDALIDLFFTPAGSILGLTIFIIFMISLTVIRREFSFISIVLTILLMMMYWDYVQTYPEFIWNIIVLMLTCVFNGFYAVLKGRR